MGAGMSREERERREIMMNAHMQQQGGYGNGPVMATSPAAPQQLFSPAVATPASPGAYPAPQAQPAGFSTPAPMAMPVGPNGERGTISNGAIVPQGGPTPAQNYNVVPAKMGVMGSRSQLQQKRCCNAVVVTILFLIATILLVIFIGLESENSQYSLRKCQVRNHIIFSEQCTEECNCRGSGNRRTCDTCYYTCYDALVISQWTCGEKLCIGQGDDATSDYRDEDDLRQVLNKEFEIGKEVGCYVIAGDEGRESSDTDPFEIWYNLHLSIVFAILSIAFYVFGIIGLIARCVCLRPNRGLQGPKTVPVNVTSPFQ